MTQLNDSLTVTIGVLGLALTLAMSQPSQAQAEDGPGAVPTCDSLLSQGLPSEELFKHLTDLSQVGGSLRLLDEALDLDHAKLGVEGQEVLDKLNQLMVGHDEVKVALARAVQRGVKGTQNPGRTVANFLLLGITGTGKTLTAEALAEAINGDPQAFVMINGGEMQEDHQINKITGSPAGYVGHGTTPPLITSKILESITSKKYGVNIVLVDEMEKASPSLQKLLLGIMDKGKMTTGSNETIDFSKTILIMTSNLGQAEMNHIINDQGPSIGFTGMRDKAPEFDRETRSKQLRSAALQATKRFLSPEFRNRIDQTFVFEELTHEESQKVLNHNLALVQRKSFFTNEQTRVLFNVTPEARHWILTKGYDRQFGGRSIRRALEGLLVEPLTNLIGSSQIQSGDLVEVSVAEVDSPRLTFKKVAEGLSMAQQVVIYHKIFGDGVPPLLDALAKPDETTPSEKSVTLKTQVPDTLGLEATRKIALVKMILVLEQVDGLNEKSFLAGYYTLVQWDKFIYGFERNSSLVEAMAREGFGEWLPYLDFEPYRLRYFWRGLEKLKSVDLDNVDVMREVTNKEIESIESWLNTQTLLKEEFKRDLIAFLRALQMRALNLAP